MTDTRRRRGVMTVVAVFMVGLVTAALAAAAAASDLRRTRTVIARAQLRQLLLAAGADVASRSTAWGAAPHTSWTLALPAELPGYAVQVQVGPADAATAEATVTADGLRATQRLTWTRTAARWHLAAVALDGP